MQTLGRGVVGKTPWALCMLAPLPTHAPPGSRERPRVAGGPYPLQDVNTNEVSGLGQVTILIKEAFPFCLVDGWLSLHLTKTTTSAFWEELLAFLFKCDFLNGIL